MTIQFVSLLSAPPVASSKYVRSNTDRKVIVIRSIAKGAK